jgi:outer membrane receptor protein involved in Fe transport
LVDGVLPAKENNFSGKALDNAPDYRLTLDAQYTWKTPVGDFIAKAEAEYSSEFYFSPDNDPLMTQDAYVKGNLFGTYRPNESWELSAYAKNIANKTTLTSAGVATTLVGNPVYGAFAPPRLYGASIQYRF